MAFKLRLKTNQKKRQWAKYMRVVGQRVRVARMLQSQSTQVEGFMAEIGNCNETPVAEPQLQQTQMGFLHPPGFEVAAFLIVAIDRNGQPYTNAPPHTAVALRLATLAMDFASQKAIVHMQKSDQEQSRIVTAPAGTVPPWIGRTGRG